MPKKTWVEQEILNIQTQRRLKVDVKNKKLLRMVDMKKLLVLPLFVSLLLINQLHSELYFKCSKCDHLEEIVVDKEAFRFFPDTWRCRNEKCGYENYEGLDYCSLCGRKR